MLFGLAVTITALLFPSANDLYCFRVFPDRARIRGVEFLKDIPFTWRRPLTAVLALVMVGAVALLLVSVASSPIASAAIIASLGFVVPWVFEHAYGYRSFIMRAFAFSLFCTTSVAILIQAGVIHDIPPFFVSASIGVWGTFWFVVLGVLWATTEDAILVTQQKGWHSVYLLIFGIGHVVVFGKWIFPLVKIGV